MAIFQTIWGWQPALYLFLGGLAAGSFIVAGFIRMLAKDKLNFVVTIGMWFALICLGVGLILLVADVSQPLRALQMWKSFSHVTSSWMAIGAWLLFFAAIAFFVSAILCTDVIVNRIVAKSDESDQDSAHAKSTISMVANGFTVAGMVLALGVALYTGILLACAPGIDFWNNPVLPVLFTVSALDTGVAAVAVIAVIAAKKWGQDTSRLHHVLECGTLVLVIVEALALTALLLTSSGEAAMVSVDAITQGWLAIPFWVLVVVVGLAIPLAVAAVSVISKKITVSRKVLVASACCACIGGCALRFVVVYAGAHLDMANTLLTSIL